MMLKLSIGGDLMCLREETEAVRRKFGRLDYSGYLSGLKPLFADSDYVIANLETPIDPTQSETDRSIQFNSPPEFAKEMRAVGFDFFSTANNHCLDRGICGLCKTLDVLDELGLDHSGTYRTIKEADTIFVKEISNLKIAIVCSTFGTNSQVNGEMLAQGEGWRIDLLRKQVKFRKLPLPDDISGGNFKTYIADEVSSAAISNPTNLTCINRVVEKIRRAKTFTDIVIAMPHVGGQYNPGPATYTKYVVAAMKSAGADMVVAGHPHVPHRCDKWDGKGCFASYSLGNLCFTPDVGFFVRNVLSEYGVVLHAYIDTRTKKLSRVTFDVVKNVVDEDGCSHAMPVVDLLDRETNAAKRDRLLMENEVVVNRFRGTIDDVVPQYEYQVFPNE